MFHGTCGTVKITIGSMIVGSMHPISSGKKAKSLPRLTIIPRNLFSSAGNMKPPPSILSFRRVSSVNQCPMSCGSSQIDASIFSNLLLPNCIASSTSLYTWAYLSSSTSTQSSWSRLAWPSHRWVIHISTTRRLETFALIPCCIWNRPLPVLENNEKGNNRKRLKNKDA